MAYIFIKSLNTFCFLVSKFLTFINEDKLIQNKISLGVEKVKPVRGRGASGGVIFRGRRRLLLP